MDLSMNQIPNGVLTYALNASVENFDANSTTYQNEPANALCLEFPEGFQLIGKHFINEKNKHIFFLVNTETQESEIGYMDNNDCVYRKYINASCLNFDINYPIQKVVHKITNCTTEIYWPDQNGRRFMDLLNLPYKTEEGADICDNQLTTEIDCNKLRVQPVFKIPQLEVVDVVSGGNLQAGTVQFAIQYCDVAGDAYTSYYSVTNPTPITKSNITTPDFNYPVGRSVVLNISNIDVTGYFQYYNLAVIKTVNAITSVELIGTYFIESTTKTITYSGQNQTQIRLTIGDIFEKFPHYEIADDITTLQDTLVWKGLTSIDRINYQQIASQITLQWETWKIPATKNYSDELLATNFRGYLRDEVYPFEIVFLLDSGKQTDGFHIPGRLLSYNEASQPDVLDTNPDFIGNGTSAKYWQTYNTASVSNTNSYASDENYEGPYQVGEFAYWESADTYPCNEDIWGDLAGQPIRHHKFPDVLVSPIFESSSYNLTDTLTPIVENKAIFPIGVKINTSQIISLITQSNLTQEQKGSIVGFKIVRGDRSTNRSIIAKGILRNVGKYTREAQTFYFPNYPYNDLQVDPFLLEASNAYNSQCTTYKFTIDTAGTYGYTNCENNTSNIKTGLAGEEIVICSITPPQEITATFIAVPTDITPDTWLIASFDNSTVVYISPITEEEASVPIYAATPLILEVKSGTTPFINILTVYIFKKITTNKNEYCYPKNLEAFTLEESKYRHVFNSPETSFGQPFLGDILKIESAIFGGGKGHFVSVKNNANYKLLTKEAQEDALVSSATIADITGTFNQTAMFTAYQAYLTIYVNGITRKNYGWSYNSIASYNYTAPVLNGLGIKQRKLDIAQYLIPGVQSVNDIHNINNFNRESSVYLKTIEGTPLPYAQDTSSLLVGTTPLIVENSRFTNSQKNCATPEKEFPIDVISYYGSLKNSIINQWGQIYSYETIDTGFQNMLEGSTHTFFGGDTFINQFSFKTKLPFFIDNRVNAPDDSDVFYDEIGNVAYPQYWHSSRSILYDYEYSTGKVLTNIISIKAHNFDCPNNQNPPNDSLAVPPVVNPGRTFYDGKMYMFAYGIPTFYVESSINVDLRQAFNNREGDFYPHVSTGIPDDWVQESFVPIIQDNTYHYNVTYSKQNKENYFSHLPVNWKQQLCYTNFPFRAIYSERQQSYSDNRINSWLIYKPVSFFDFPQNFGNFTSIDGIENRQLLARFDNKSLLYNALYTNQTNVQNQVYMGQTLFSKETPPLDFAETDLGYVGSQHKFLLKIPQGQVTVDAKRGQVFLIHQSKGGIPQAMDLSGFGSGLNRFFTDHLAFEILRYFPTVDVDNNFKGLGLHGVYDSKFDRIIITKLDYIPFTKEVLYDESLQKFYVLNEYPQTVGEPLVLKEFVNLTDSNYFCNKSWTLSFNMNTMSWISFHSYIPNWYIAENNFFYSGINESCDLEAIAGYLLDCTLEATLLNCTVEGTAFVTTVDCTLTGTAEK